MRIDLNELNEITKSCVEDGVGLISNRSFKYKNYQVTVYRIYSDSFIGMHEADDEFIYVLEGNGYIFYDGNKDALYPGIIYFTEKGRELSITSADPEELVILEIKKL